MLKTKLQHSSSSDHERIVLPCLKGRLQIDKNQSIVLKMIAELILSFCLKLRIYGQFCDTIKSVFIQFCKFYIKAREIYSFLRKSNKILAFKSFKLFFRAEINKV